MRWNRTDETYVRNQPGNSWERESARARYALWDGRAQAGRFTWSNISLLKALLVSFARQSGQSPFSFTHLLIPAAWCWLLLLPWTAGHVQCKHDRPQHGSFAQKSPDEIQFNPQSMACH
jgi:hypothetical protein